MPIRIRNRVMVHRVYSIYLNDHHCSHSHVLIQSKSSDRSAVTSPASTNPSGRDYLSHSSKLYASTATKNLAYRNDYHCTKKLKRSFNVDSLKMEFHLVKVAHLKHCVAYKKIVFKCIFSVLPFSDEIEKYLFTFVGVFPLHSDFLKNKVDVPVFSRFSRSSLLQKYAEDPLPCTEDDSEAFVSYKA